MIVLTVDKGIALTVLCMQLFPIYQIIIKMLFLITQNFDMKIFDE